MTYCQLDPQGFTSLNGIKIPVLLIFYQENAFENVYKKAAIFFLPQSVKPLVTHFAEACVLP